jgi:hypothetical protein
MSDFSLLARQPQRITVSRDHAQQILLAQESRR